MGEARSPLEAETTPQADILPRRDWTKGSVPGNLLSLAWPMIITQGMTMLGQVIDMIWVGRLGAASVAGVGVSMMAVQLINTAMMGLAVGMRAMIARFIGAGDTEGANHVAQQSFVISTIFAATIAIIGIFLADKILVAFGVEADVATEGAAYMRIMFVGSLAMSYRMVSESIMQASGDTRTPMKIAVFYRLFHLVLCPLLIFGVWIFPSMGVSGAAVTNIFSESLGLGIGLWILFTGRTRLRLTLKNFRIDPGIIWRIVRIALPSSISSMARPFAQAVLMWIIIPFGTLSVAAHTIVQRAEMVLVTPSLAMGVTSGILAGQNLGAGQPERAERTGWLAVTFIQSFAVIFCLVVFLWAESVVGIFSPDPGVIEIGGKFVRIATGGFMVMGTYITLMQCISGIGDTIPSMLVTTIGMWAIEVPLAFILPGMGNLGVFGVRWATVIGLLVGVTAFIIYFKSGRWKRKRV
ncbi:MATE family efflux transporter [Chloroflexota bacterium]